MKRPFLLLVIVTGGLTVILMVTIHASIDVVLLAIVSYLVLTTLSMYGWLRYQEQKEYFALENKKVEHQASLHRDSQLLSNQLQSLLRKASREQLSEGSTDRAARPIDKAGNAQVLQFRVSGQKDPANSDDRRPNGQPGEESAS
jgi:hypothetical protein